MDCKLENNIKILTKILKSLLKDEINENNERPMLCNWECLLINIILCNIVSTKNWET